MKWILPNACTAANLFFGMLSILSTYEGDFFNASVFILLALIADGMDGRVARALNAASELGKEMDSLCDLGSFGIAPAFLAYAFCLNNYGLLGKAAAIIFALCGMWRLARFNVNTSVVHGFFMGLAIPAGGCIVATTTLLFPAMDIHPENFGLVYPITMIIVAYLMVSHVHYPDFKGGGEKIFLVAKIFAAVMFASIIFLTQAAIVQGVLTAIFSTYAVFGIVNSLIALMTRKAD
ncbi:MAG: CDP-diacylglycerol--serine O-phosphatidyltransferase [Selenomonadaceae bacterium]|nr:CDP-diacylglycerol--serine O-phosphatidyltransferase [Selenomonadaceae bacterium]